MKLQQQLEYNWERGYYSVVKNCDGKYYIFSTKATDGRFRMSCLYDSVAAAKLHIGETTGWDNNDYYALKYELKIVDTIHPSELMGKGFQVGDKVSYNGRIMEVDHFSGDDACIFGMRERGGAPVFDGWHTSAQVRPALPVAESSKEYCRKGYMIPDCHFPEGYSKTCDCCGLAPRLVTKDVYHAFQLLQIKGIIKEGKIVNL